jgi:hypothetical protein
MSEEAADDLMAAAHIECIQCGADGCKGCPSYFCDLPRLIEHAGEHMHAECVGAFDALTDNAVPRYVDEVEETTPVPPETMAVVVAGRLR